MTQSVLQILGRYSLHTELGKGGFATVYRAMDSTLEREVALKVLKPGWTDDAKAVERFMREAKLASRLKHPNIVTIFDVGQAEGRLFIAMELVPGRSLQRIVAEDGPLPWPRALAILEQTAAALDYAHKQGLVHRDIKPANIILDESEASDAVHVVLTDFGLVRGAEQASLSAGSTGGIIGTPEYIAPEIWDGQPATQASDIYALGCVAYYMLTGKVLFGATTPMAVLKRHVEGPIFPAQWPADVPESVPEVLSRALSKEPDQRPATAGKFVAELRECEDRATREQAARAARKQQEEAESAAQIALAAEAAHRTEERQAAVAAQEKKRQEAAAENARREAERKTQEEQAKREAAEQERQAVIAAQEKAKQEAEAVAIAAQLRREAEEKVRHEAKKREQQVAAEKAQLAEAQRARQLRQLSPTPQEPQVKSRTSPWLFIVGALVVVAIVAVLASGGGRPATVVELPTQAPVAVVPIIEAPTQVSGGHIIATSTTIPTSVPTVTSIPSSTSVPPTQTRIPPTSTRFSPTNTRAPTATRTRAPAPQPTVAVQAIQINQLGSPLAFGNIEAVSPGGPIPMDPAGVFNWCAQPLMYIIQIPVANSGSQPIDLSSMEFGVRVEEKDGAVHERTTQGPARLMPGDVVRFSIIDIGQPVYKVNQVHKAYGVVRLPSGEIKLVTGQYRYSCIQ